MEELEWEDMKVEGEIVRSYLHLPGAEVMLHRHINYPGSWLMRCNPLGFDLHPLKATDLILAKDEALTTIIHGAGKMLRLASDILDALDGSAKNAESNT